MPTTRAAKMDFSVLPFDAHKKWCLDPHASLLTVSPRSPRNILRLWQKHSLCIEHCMTIFHQQNLTASRAQLQGILGTVVSRLPAPVGQQVEGERSQPISLHTRPQTSGCDQLRPSSPAQLPFECSCMNEPRQESPSHTKNHPAKPQNHDK